MKILSNYCKLYKVCCRDLMEDLFPLEVRLRGEEVLNNAFVKDFLHQKELPFVFKGKRYIRHYLWEPQGGVTKIKIGYMVKSKFVGAVVYVNFSRLRYAPYIVILDRNKAFDTIDTVACMVAKALSWASKTYETILDLKPWEPDTDENIKWGSDCLEAHGLGDGKGVLSSQPHFGLENFVNQTTSKCSKKKPPKTKRKKTKFAAFILKGDTKKVMRYLHEKIDALNEPKFMMKVVVAAMYVGVLDGETEFMYFQTEFNKQGAISKTSYNYYVRNRKELFLHDRMYDKYVEELKDVI